ARAKWASTSSTIAYTSDVLPASTGLLNPVRRWPRWTQPPSGASSSACMPSSPVRISSRKPNASVRKSIAAAPSSYSREGKPLCSRARRLGRLRRRVLEKCFRCPPGDPAELGDQMRLVGEAALEGELAPGHRPGELARPLEAQEPRDRL